MDAFARHRRPAEVLLVSASPRFIGTAAAKAGPADIVAPAWIWIEGP
jgi:hypothetical protein